MELQQTALKVVADTYSAIISVYFGVDVKPRHLRRELRRVNLNWLCFMIERYSDDFWDIVTHNREDLLQSRKFRRQYPESDLLEYNNTWGFDILHIRWMFEGRWDQVHPDDDWDHPAWRDPDKIFELYSQDQATR